MFSFLIIAVAVLFVFIFVISLATRNQANRGRAQGFHPSYHSSGDSFPSVSQTFLTDHHPSPQQQDNPDGIHSKDDATPCSEDWSSSSSWDSGSSSYDSGSSSSDSGSSDGGGSSD